MGYVILKYEFDSTKGEFTCTSFTKVNSTGGNITESIKAIASKSFVPISYQFTGTSTISGVTLIDAKFKNQTMSGTITKDGKVTPIQQKIGDDVFLSSYLLYVMLQSKNGMKTGLKYDYKAIAEEDGAVSNGTAFIASEELYKGQKVFKILNDFKQAKFVSYVNHKGEILATLSPAQNVSTELTVSSQEAVKNVGFPEKTLISLFGEIPKGKHSLLPPKGG